MDKLTPANRPVPRADGLKMGNANTTLTTPNPTFGMYSSGYNEGKDAINKGNIMGSSTEYSVAAGKQGPTMKP